MVGVSSVIPAMPVYDIYFQLALVCPANVLRSILFLLVFFTFGVLSSSFEKFHYNLAKINSRGYFFYQGQQGMSRKSKTLTVLIAAAILVQDGRNYRQTWSRVRA